jgi:hypothetical protein
LPLSDPNAIYRHDLPTIERHETSLSKSVFIPNIIQGRAMHCPFVTVAIDATWVSNKAKEIDMSDARMHLFVNFCLSH